MYISVSLAKPGGGGGGGGDSGAIAPLPTPLPHNAFSELCRYIGKIVGTCDPGNAYVIILHPGLGFH